MITYILIGIAFMFCIEYLLNLESIKKRMSVKHDLNSMIWTQRFIGVIFWPVWLGVFLYNFFKSYFN